MRMRSVGVATLLWACWNGATAQVNIYPNPPQATPPRNAGPSMQSARPTVSPMGAPAGNNGAVNWYPNPTPYPQQQGVVPAMADGALPPRPPMMPPQNGVLPNPGPNCADPSQPYMQDVASATGDGGACDCLCGPPGRVWISAEYLRWTTKGNGVPPLLTTAPPGTAAAVAGTIGAPGTTVLLGGSNLNNDWRSGIRAGGGYWFDESNTCGIEGDFFYLGASKYSATIGSNGSQILTRPFTDNVVFNAVGAAVAVAPFANTELLSFPGVVAGQMTVTSQTDLIGGGANFICNGFCNDDARFDWLVGYRYLNLNDTLTIQENLVGLAGSNFPGVGFGVTDRFRTENHFHGVNGGFNFERRFDRFFVGLKSSVALGVTHHVAEIDGGTRITETNGRVTNYAGGLSALASNIGHYTANSFSVVPEATAKLGYQVTDHLRIYGAYNYLYWSNVLRTGGIIDTRVNTSLLPPSGGAVGPAFPKYEPSRTGFYAHGVSVGAELRY